jgi:hypothetical protein
MEHVTNVWFVAAAWMLLAFVASMLSIRTGISVALLEIAMGIVAGNFLGFHTSAWINFLATFGAGLLTFLAGAEIDPERGWPGGAPRSAHRTSGAGPPALRDGGGGRPAGDRTQRTLGHLGEAPRHHGRQGGRPRAMLGVGSAMRVAQPGAHVRREADSRARPSQARDAVRAAWLLGRLRATDTLTALMRVVQQTRDPYLAEAAVDALGEIGDPIPRPVLERAATDGAVRVRQAARRPRPVAAGVRRSIEIQAAQAGMGCARNRRRTVG